MYVYHVLNPHQQPMWHAMLQWLKKKEDFDIVSPQEWVNSLENSGLTEHSAMKLLGLWKETYCDATQEKKPRPQFSMVETVKPVRALRDIPPVGGACMGKIWDWVQANVH